MYYKDLTPYSRYMPSEVENVLNIGWIDKEHDFEQAPPPHGLVEKINSILSVRENGLNCRVNQKRCFGKCHLCETSNYGQFSIVACELWIPSTNEGYYFATPASVIHYIQDHFYRPPQIFVDAVMELSLDKCFVAQHLYCELIGMPRHLWYHNP